MELDALLDDDSLPAVVGGATSRMNADAELTAEVDRLLMEKQQLQDELDTFRLQAEAERLELDLTIAELRQDALMGGSTPFMQAENMEIQQELNDVKEAFATLRSWHVKTTRDLETKIADLERAQGEVEENTSMVDYLKDNLEAAAEDLKTYQEALELGKDMHSMHARLEKEIQEQLELAHFEHASITKAFKKLSTISKQKCFERAAEVATLEREVTSLEEQLKTAKSHLAPRWKQAMDARLKNGLLGAGPASLFLRARQAEITAQYYKEEAAMIEAVYMRREEDRRIRSLWQKAMVVPLLQSKLQMVIQYIYEGHFREMRIDGHENPQSLTKDKSFMRWLYELFSQSAELMFFLCLLVNRLSSSALEADLENEDLLGLFSTLEEAMSFIDSLLTSFANEMIMSGAAFDALKGSILHVVQYLGPDTSWQLIGTKSDNSPPESVEAMLVGSLLLRLLPVGLAAVGNCSVEEKTNKVLPDDVWWNLYDALTTILQEFPWGGVLRVDPKGEIVPTEDLGHNLHSLFNGSSTGILQLQITNRENAALPLLKTLGSSGDFFKEAFLGSQATFDWEPSPEIHRASSVLERNINDVQNHFVDLVAKLDTLVTAVGEALKMMRKPLSGTSGFPVKQASPAKADQPDTSDILQKLQEAHADTNNLNLQLENYKTDLEKKDETIASLSTKVSAMEHKHQQSSIVAKEAERLLANEEQSVRLLDNLRRNVAESNKASEVLRADFAQQKERLREMSDRVDRYRRRAKRSADTSGNSVLVELANTRTLVQQMVQTIWTLQIENAENYLTASCGNFERLEKFVHTNFPHRLKPVRHHHVSSSEAMLGEAISDVEEREEPSSRIALSGLLQKLRQLEEDVYCGIPDSTTATNMPTLLAELHKGNIRQLTKCKELHHRVAELGGLVHPIRSREPELGRILSSGQHIEPSTPPIGRIRLESTGGELTEKLSFSAIDLQKIQRLVLQM